jgi:hypothetical protein
MGVVVARPQPTMENTRILEKSKKETNIMKNQTCCTSQIVSHHMLVLHKGRNYMEQDEEKYIGSTNLNMSPSCVATSSHIAQRKMSTKRQHSEHVMSKCHILPYSSENLPRSEGVVGETGLEKMKQQQKTNAEVLPNLIHRYMSIPELNTPSEIRLIEDNIRENDLLKKWAEQFDDESESTSASESLLEITHQDPDNDS